MFESISLLIFAVILVLDMLVTVRRPAVPSFKEALFWCFGYVALALAFFCILLHFRGLDDASMFLTGWLIEYSLSIDNIFVFITIIVFRFAVPEIFQRYVLSIGILIAIFLRAIFIFFGSVVIEAFSWTFFIFGALLIYTALKQFSAKGHTSGLLDKVMIRMNVSKNYDSMRLRTGPRGSRRWTPMVAVFIAIGVADTMFALDSIPAIFGITTDPFLVLAANFFSLTGLRQLYFVLSECVHRLEYMKFGVAALLAFIGIKLVLDAGHSHGIPFIPESSVLFPVINIWVSLSVILLIIALSVALSLIKTKKPKKLNSVP
ncbi:TerC/Alx family metal homeostasis membrane protein [Tropheryma whipplei]|uniref:TerC/Alx family metal homeostasis membrane protein n=1 Tax=Tropheryma whipplei TaxID=2039 RepID=UPI0004ACE0D5|nr:TerC/Alx family metal homeostasis membrane protein [Tropheryma whipplei]